MRRNPLSRALVAADALSTALTGCALDTTAPRPATEDDLTSAALAVSAGAGIADDVSILLLSDLVLAAGSPAGGLSPRSRRARRARRGVGAPPAPTTAAPGASSARR